MLRFVLGDPLLSGLTIRTATLVAVLQDSRELVTGMADMGTGTRGGCHAPMLAAPSARSLELEQPGRCRASTPEQRSPRQLKSLRRPRPTL